MLGESAASDHSSSGDTLGELCNMVAGNFKSKISTLADHCMLSVPTVIAGADYAMETSEPTEVVIVPLLFEGLPVWISLSTPSRNIRAAASARNSFVGAGLFILSLEGPRPPPTYARFKLHVASRTPRLFFRYSWN
jgi:Chemotaxis phosphatase CheX